MAWNALISGGLVQRDIVVGVALCAMGAEVSSVAAPDSRHVLVMVGALERVIARGMTAHAPRMRNNFPISAKIARERSAWSPIDSNSDGPLRLWWTTDFGSVSANAAESAVAAEQPIDTIKKTSVPTSLPHLKSKR